MRRPRHAAPPTEPQTLTPIPDVTVADCDWSDAPPDSFRALLFDIWTDAVALTPPSVAPSGGSRFESWCW